MGRASGLRLAVGFSTLGFQVQSVEAFAVHLELPGSGLGIPISPTRYQG